MLRTGICLECGSMVIEEDECNEKHDSFGYCRKCDNNGWVLDDIVIPWHRIGTLCSLYHNVNYLDVNDYTIGDIVKIEYVAGKKKGTKLKCEVFHVLYFEKFSYHKTQTLILKTEEGKYLYLTDTKTVEDAYSDLCGSNRRTLWRWKHKILKITSNDRK